MGKIRYNDCMSTKIEAPRPNTETETTLQSTPAQEVSKVLPAIYSLSSRTLAIKKDMASMKTDVAISDREYDDTLKAVLKSDPKEGKLYIQSELKTYDQETEAAILEIEKRLESMKADTNLSPEYIKQQELRVNVEINMHKAELKKAKAQSETAINQLQNNFPSTPIFQDLVTTAQPAKINRADIPRIPIDMPLATDPKTGAQVGRFVHDDEVLVPKTDVNSIHERTKLVAPQPTPLRQPKPKFKIGTRVKDIISNWGKKNRQPLESKSTAAQNLATPSNGLTQEQNLSLASVNNEVDQLRQQLSTTPNLDVSIDQTIVQPPTSVNQSTPENPTKPTEQKIVDLKADISDLQAQLQNAIHAQKPESKTKAIAKKALAKFEKLRYGAPLTSELKELKASIKSQETIIYNLTRQLSQMDQRVKSGQNLQGSDKLKTKANELHVEIEKLKKVLRQDKDSLNYGISDHKELAKDPNAFGELTKSQLELNYQAAKAILDAELATLIATNAKSARVNNNSLIIKKRAQISDLTSKHRVDLKYASSDEIEN
jgi:hypothetical protein